jgi:hypothetical protein
VIETTEDFRRDRVQARDKEVGGGKIGPDLREVEKAAVGDDGKGDLRHGLDPPQDGPKARVKGRLPGPRHGDVVNPGAGLQGLPDISQDCIHGDINLPLGGEALGPPKLTIDAVQVACFIREGVHAQREAESPRWNRTEDVAQVVFLTLEKRAPCLKGSPK